MPTQTKAKYLRNFIFGVEDSLVSTVGLISGVAAAGLSTKNVILTGVVLVFVESFSMAVGSYLSENSAAEYENQGQVALGYSAGYAIVMLLSYLAAGFLVIAPYTFAPSGAAFTLSIIISLAALFCLGLWSAAISKTSKLRMGFLMLLLGGVAILLGIFVGQLVRNLV